MIYETPPPDVAKKIFLDLASIVNIEERLLFFANMISNNTNQKKHQVVYDFDKISLEILSCTDHRAQVIVFDRYFGEFLDIYNANIL